MAFAKGQPKTGGRKRGTPNKATQDLRAFVNEALEASQAQFLKDLEAMEARDRVTAFLKLLEFALPKLNRTQSEVSGIDGAPIEVTAIKFIDDSADLIAVNQLPQPTAQPIQAAPAAIPTPGPDQIEYIAISATTPPAPVEPESEHQRDIIYRY